VIAVMAGILLAMSATCHTEAGYRECTVTVTNTSDVPTTGPVVTLRLGGGLFWHFATTATTIRDCTFRSSARWGMRRIACSPTLQPGESWWITVGAMR
jgi:hypothetical protein